MSLLCLVCFLFVCLCFFFVCLYFMCFFFFGGGVVLFCFVKFFFLVSAIDALDLMRNTKNEF